MQRRCKIIFQYLIIGAVWIDSQTRANNDILPLLDPYHLKYYYEYCTFLTSINYAIKPGVCKMHCYRILMIKPSASKENFLRLKNMVLVGGKDDGVITPWQSRYA